MNEGAAGATISPSCFEMCAIASAAVPTKKSMPSMRLVGNGGMVAPEKFTLNVKSLHPRFVPVQVHAPKPLFVGQAFLLAATIKSRPASGSACPTKRFPVSITWMGHPPRPGFTWARSERHLFYHLLRR